MAGYQNTNAVSLIAGEAAGLSIGRVVKSDTDGTMIYPTAATDELVGVTCEGGVADGDVIGVNTGGGIALVEVGTGGVTQGVAVGTEALTDGRITDAVAGAGKSIIGVALDTGAVGAFVRVALNIGKLEA